jgi:hypothetical protein
MNTKKCPKCNGTGESWYDQFQGSFVECEECEGKGYIESNDNGGEKRLKREWYKYTDETVAFHDLKNALETALNRELREDEEKSVRWLAGTGWDTVGRFIDMFREQAEKYGLYVKGELVRGFNTQEEAYEAARAATKETGVVHQVKPHKFEMVKDFNIDDIDGCEFIYDSTIGKAIISFETDGVYGTPTGMIEIIYPDGSIGKLKPDEAQRKIDNGEWIIYR